jgi:hypothetical protein
MSRALDREGIFKAVPFKWDVQKAQSGAVAVSMGFEIKAQLDGSEWIDWSEYDAHHVYGSWWVVKRDGSVNQPAVEQLASCLGWTGRLSDVGGDAPEIVVQITVKEETFEGKTRIKATWMNPEDYVPEGIGASDDEVREIEARFGSLLRAAASGAAKAKPKEPPPPQEGPPPLSDDDIPF